MILKSAILYVFTLKKSRLLSEITHIFIFLHNPLIVIF